LLVRISSPYKVHSTINVTSIPRLPPSKRYQKLPLSGPSRKASGGRLGISTSQMPVAHGNTSKGVYESTAFFVRLDEYSEAADDHDEPHPGAELLFWGDVESKLDDHNDPAAQELHASVWREAAKSWDEGRLTGIFVSSKEIAALDQEMKAPLLQIECSYTSDRPADLMFGHLQPQSLHAELRQLASFVKTRTKSEATPLEGLKVYIIHVKQPMDLDPGSRNCRERIRNQLVAIEKDRCSVGQGTGVSFEMIAKGMLIRV
jgi:cAMP phosphodiesterase